MSYWSKLSMKDKADVMKLFLDKGISDLDTIRKEYNIFAGGGSIHIDPSKKGTFTAAASRHGMGVQEFASRVLANKENYSPAMVKKANFARNASKWHGLGGNLYDGTTEDSQQMTRPNIFQRPDGSYFYSTDGMKTDVTPINVLGDNPALWTYTDSSGKIYRPAQIPSTNYTLTEAEDANPLERAANNYFRELNWRAKNDPSSIALHGKYTMPLVLSPVLSKGAAVALTNPYVDAALTSGFGAHGLQSLANGEADWSTALEIAPLGRVVKPIYEGVVQPGMRLFNSPLTGNWIKIGNKEYRLSPSSLGANGSSLESRAPQITADNAANITPEQWTAAQDVAIARGDMAEAQRLRDLHFSTKSSGSDASKILYNHSTDSEPFYSFDLDRPTNHAGSARNGKGVYIEPLINLSEEPDMAVWGRNFQGDWGSNNLKLRINFENPEIPVVDNPISTHPEGYVGRVEAFVRDPRKIKLDDAVTYDPVTGERIPLGKRDDFSKNSILWGLTPFGIGLTGYGLWRGNK